VWQRVVEWIETMRSDCDDKKITIRGKWQYDAKFLLRCLVSAWHLKLTRRGGRGHNVLRSHLGDAISILFSDSLASLAGVKKSLPQRSLMYAARFQLHVSFLMVLRDENAKILNNAVVFQTCDSSFHGSRDWLHAAISRM
jgi:hypothetical protein